MSAPRFAHVTDQQVRVWVLKGLSAAEIASLIGSSTSWVESKIRQLWQEAHERGKQLPPTPDEIRQRCLEIQSSWSDDEYRKRAGHRRREVSATVVHESDLRRLAPGRR